MQEPRLRLRSGSSVPLKTGGNGESAGKGEEGRSGGIVAEAERLAERKKSPAGGAKRKAGGRAGTRQERHRRLERHRGAAASLSLVRNASSVPRVPSVNLTMLLSSVREQRNTFSFSGVVGFLSFQIMII